MTTVKFLFRKLELPIKVDDITTYTFEAAMRTVRLFPGLEGEEVAINFIDDKDDVIRINNTEDLARAFAISEKEKRVCVRLIVTVVPKLLAEATAVVRSVSQDEKVPKADEDDDDEASSDFEYIPDDDGPKQAPPPSEVAVTAATTETTTTEAAINSVEPKEDKTAIDPVAPLSFVDSVATPSETSVVTLEEEVVAPVPPIKEEDDEEAPFVEAEVAGSALSVEVEEIEKKEPVVVVTGLQDPLPVLEEEDEEEVIPPPKREDTPRFEVAPSYKEVTYVEEEKPQGSASTPAATETQDPALLLKAFEQIFEKFGDDGSNNLSPASTLRENASIVLSDPVVVQDLQTSLGSSTMKNLIVDVFTAEKNGETGGAWAAAAANMVPVLELVSGVLRKHPQLFALVPPIVALVMAEKKKQPTPPASNTPVARHENVRCDGCDTLGIEGARYKSAIVEDFDLCESCEASGKFNESHGPFLKIYTPAQAPKVILCVLEGDASPLAQFAEKEFEKNAGEKKHIFADLSEEESVEILKAVIPKGEDVEMKVSSAPAQPSCPGCHTLKQFSVPHPGFVCNGCNTRPGVFSAMYGCRICDYDLCFACFSKDAIPLAPVVVSTPASASAGSAPTFVDGCKGHHKLGHFLTPNPLFTCDSCRVRPGIHAAMYGCRICNFDLCTPCFEEMKRRKKAAKQKQPAPSWMTRPKAKFIEDLSFPDGSVVSPGQMITKTWRIENNDAITRWPAGCCVVNVGGETFGAPAIGTPVPPLGPNEKAEISISLVAPAREGRAIGYFRLVAPDLQKFGHRLWIDVNVRKPVQTPVASAFSNNAPSQHDEVEEEEAFLGEVVETTASANSNSTTTNNNNNAAFDELMQKYSNQMETLIDMGFLDFGKNLEMLEANGGNVDMVLALLLA